MYDELVTQCRDCIDCLCGDCKYEHLQKPGNFVPCMNALLGEAADAIEELKKLHETQKKNLSVITDAYMKSWIPVKERLPKYGERVLVFGGFTMYVAYYDKNRYGGESWHKLNSKSHYCNPTHWMPLPEPPKEET